MWDDVRMITPLLLPCNVCWCSGEWCWEWGWEHFPRLGARPKVEHVRLIITATHRDWGSCQSQTRPCLGSSSVLGLSTSSASATPLTFALVGRARRRAALRRRQVLTTYPHKNRGSRRTKIAWRNNTSGFIRLAQLRAVTEFKAGYLKCTCLPVNVTDNCVSSSPQDTFKTK